MSDKRLNPADLLIKPAKLLMKPAGLLLGQAGHIHPARLLRVFHKSSPPVGARPGTLVVSAGAPPPVITVARYDNEAMEELADVAPERLSELVGGDRFTWVDVTGLGDERILRAIGDQFGLHPLLLEDVVNVPQRPKVDDYGEQLLVVCRMAQLLPTGFVDVEQVSIILGPSYVITFQERNGDVLEPVRRRLRDPSTLMRSKGPAYLAYAILDTIIDAFYPLLEALGEVTETLEEEVMMRPSPQVLRQLSRLKTDLLRLRRAAWPQRDAVAALVRGEHPHIPPDMRVFFRDTYDHCIQAADVIDSYREMANGLMNTHLSVVANKTNEVMKVLTIMASIFIPLTFIAGVYGMNFEFMPELKIWWSYPLLLGIMCALGVGMLLYFRHLGWFGRRPRRDQDDPGG